MTNQRTLVLIKPDGVARGLVSEILGRIESRGYKIVALELRTLTKELAEQHYAEHKGRDFYEPLVTFITSGPLVAAVIEGAEVISAWRAMQGATNPFEAAPGTIRADLATSNRLNLTHGSDSAESAKREIGLFFPNLK
ncbi:MAG: nucleoside-diphosphate kinase [Actinobacteria bacterium]|nr:nucleoside-diphosphate kinase [Actinomycetota bacterium]